MKTAMNRRNFIQGATATVGAAALLWKNNNSAAAQALVPTVQPMLISSPHFAGKPEAPATTDMGSFLVPYTHIPNISESYRLYQPHNGMMFNVTYMVANVMDNDGVKYNLFREYKGFDSLNAVATRSIPDGVSMAQPLFKPGEMYLGKCNNDMVDEKTFQVTPYLADPSLLTIVRQPQKAHWTDVNGRIDLEYRCVGPALEYYCPGLAEDTMYRSEPYLIKGTVEGKAVHGYGVIDTAWGTPGIAWEQSKIFRYLEEYWVVWCNEYEDGSVETGVYMDGVDQFGCGYFNRDGVAVVSGQSKAEIQWTPDEFLQGANFTVAGQPFVFAMDTRVVQVPHFLNWASGSVTRVGETRTPVRSFAWLEYLPKR